VDVTRRRFSIEFAPPAARHEVERLFGQCLLQVQALELLMKAIVATHQISGSVDTLEDAQARRIAETRRKTMGALVRDMMEGFLVPERHEGLRDQLEDGPAISLSLQVRLPANELPKIEADHRELVALRNALVHHFLEDHDLRSEEGCHVAVHALSAAIDRIDRAYGDLLGWAAEMQKARKALVEQLTSPEIRDSIACGRIPWPATTIAHALQDAAKNLAYDGWTCVEAAMSWITTHHPDERPENYGCRTWRQVIHDSQLFDLQIRRVDGRRQAWYRPRAWKREPS
jgi:hypothetical protein